jgi:hypothetical protein
MRKSLLALLVVLLPACAAAQGTVTSPTAPVPRGPDTPIATVPGGTATVTPPLPSNTMPTPAVDSAGANRSSTDSSTGEAKPPIGAPRLPGEPSNPPTGPND